jgi:phage/plasmid-like protein (TIGR03299 family)
MSHEITELDTVVATSQTWHKLETIKPEIDYYNSGLAWDAEKSPIFLEDGRVIPGHSVVVAKDHPVGIVSDSYEVIQNHRIFEMIDKSLKGVDYEIVTAGSLGGLSKVFVSVSLKDHASFEVNGDKFRSFLDFATSHDGSMRYCAFDSNIRIVCANTYRAALNSKGAFRSSVSHKKGAEDNLVEVERNLETIFAGREAFATAMRTLAEKPMTLSQAESVLAGWVAPDDAEILSTRSTNKVADMLERFEKGDGNKGETRYDLFNGITEHYTRAAVKSSAGKNFGSSEFGTGNTKKQEALELLIDDKSVFETQERGIELLSC